MGKYGVELDAVALNSLLSVMCRGDDRAQAAQDLFEHTCRSYHPHRSAPGSCKAATCNPNTPSRIVVRAAEGRWMLTDAKVEFSNYWLQSKKLNRLLMLLGAAKEEAEREIAEYRAQMEAEFQRKVAESSGDSGANVKRLEQETDTKIAQLKEQAANVSPEVIQMLLRHVTTVKN
uniref:Vacuolar ATP synthase subunit G 1 n=2 Tax=Oryza sativa subsp. japonica TaxID=39947 RepID=Q6ZHJ9_ORYSJ|nr:putative Vacuolar ATP synthase subunit G 1 [Oryza sativa Japonica Group]BAD07544.1 putative Vacuolar ATP synthase subunit G 1 [Oryza sativa Japonica Group]